MPKQRRGPRPIFPWPYETLLAFLVGDHISSAKTWPERRRYFKEFLKWWKSEYDTIGGYSRMSSHCPAWMHNNDWTPESIIERLQKEPIDQEDHFYIASWFHEWNKKIRLSQRGRNNAKKRWGSRPPPKT